MSLRSGVSVANYFFSYDFIPIDASGYIIFNDFPENNNVAPQEVNEVDKPKNCNGVICRYKNGIARNPFS